MIQLTSYFCDVDNTFIWGDFSRTLKEIHIFRRSTLVRNLLFLLSITIFCFGQDREATVSGTCFLQNQSDHSGVYFVKMLARPSAGRVAGEYIDTRKLMLIK